MEKSLLKHLARLIGVAIVTGLATAAGLSQTANVQVIHNAADPAAAFVDIYVDDTKALDNFGFREATGFLALTAGSEIVIGVADSASSSSADAIASFPVTLDEDGTYVVVANGVLDPSSFAANPGGLETGFGLIVQDMGQEASTDPEQVQFFALTRTGKIPLAK